MCQAWPVRKPPVTSSLFTLPPLPAHGRKIMDDRLAETARILKVQGLSVYVGGRSLRACRGSPESRVESTMGRSSVLVHEESIYTAATTLGLIPGASFSIALRTTAVLMPRMSPERVFIQQIRHRQPGASLLFPLHRHGLQNVFRMVRLQRCVVFGATPAPLGDRRHG